MPAGSGLTPDPPTVAASLRPACRQCSRGSARRSTAAAGSPSGSSSPRSSSSASSLLVLRPQSPTRLAAWAIAPAVLERAPAPQSRWSWSGGSRPSGRRSSTPARPGRPGASGSTGIALIALVVTVPHLLVWQYGSLAGDAFGSVFGGQVLSATGRSPSARAGADRADQRPAARRRRDGRAHDDADRHDDGGLARPGRAHGVDGLGPARPRERPARQRRRLRPEAQLADVLCRAPPRRVPARAASGPSQDAIGAMLEIDIQYYARVDFAGFVAHGRCRRRRRRERQEEGPRTRATTASAWSRRVRRHARARTTSPGRRRSRTPGSARAPARATSRVPSASSRSSSRCATASRGSGSILFELPGCSGPWATRSRPTSRSTGCPSSRRSWTRWAARARWSARSSAIRSCDAKQRATARRRCRPQEDPRGGRRAVQRSGHAADAVADPQADQDAEADADALSQGGRRVVGPSARPRGVHAAKRSSSASRSAIDGDQRPMVRRR